MRLTALSEGAEALGLKPGQGVAEARAMCPGLEVLEEDAAADRHFLEAVADWCDRYTPLVALDGTDGLFLDITGCAHLFGGEEALLKDILARLRRMGMDACGAVASSPGLASAVCRFGSGGIVTDADIAGVLAPLPVASLRLEEETVAALSKLGLKRVGDIMTAARAPLARRFGAFLLLRLDQALCLDEEPISPRRPVASLSAERRLAEPVVAEEDILALAGQIAVSLKPSMEARGVGGRAFELVLFRVDGAVFRICAGASRPLRDPQRIARLFSQRLQAVHDDLDTGYGFEILRLNVLHHEAFEGTQASFGGDRQSEASLAAFIDSVSARLGADCLQAFRFQESHVPERASATVFAADGLAAKLKASGPETPRSERPLRLFTVPERVEVLLAEIPEGPPQSFRWRRQQHRVSRSEGPERIAMEWWIDGLETPTRDYFRIEDEAGRRFWIYRQGLYDETPSPLWFVHGVFA